LVGEKQEIIVKDDSLARSIYNKDKIVEMFNCSYNLNDKYIHIFADSDLHPVGENKHGDVRIIEIPSHTFFLAMLFQPQLSSEVTSPHPVIVAFLESALWRATTGTD
jgi:CTP synthase (UTP-ammonia lyase)